MSNTQSQTISYNAYISASNSHYKGFTYSSRVSSTSSNNGTQSALYAYFSSKEIQNPGFTEKYGKVLTTTYSYAHLIGTQSHKLGITSSFSKFANIGTHSVGTQSVGTQSHPFASVVKKQNKFFVKPSSKTKQVSVNSLVNIVSSMTNTSETKSTSIITKASVTINGNLVTDINYQVKTGDIIRVGLGHILNNSNLMVIVK